MDAIHSTDPTFLYGGNASFVEALYEDYLADPSAIDPDWRKYFDSMKAPTDTPHSAVQRAFADLVARGAHLARPSAPAPEGPGGTPGPRSLINAYRQMGHLKAKFNPLHLTAPERVLELEPAYHGLSATDLQVPVSDGVLQGPLNQVIQQVEAIYCGSIGYDFGFVPRLEREWLTARIEPKAGKSHFDAATKKRIMAKLNAAEGLEKYLHTRYVGQKRFSLEGGETFIPLLDMGIQSAGGHGVKQVVIGMAHRGRLNTLINIFGKKSSELFAEFEGKKALPADMSGDVKYHMGYSSDVATAGGPVHLVLAYNPSHLELVDPVVEGSVRARQDRYNDKARRTVLPILIHGDSAVAGQGIVPETLNLSQLRGYATGGTVHVVINNQVGFTTSEVRDVRSSRYCTDIAKFVDAPVFHVNGDDPEAAVFAMQLAIDYQQAFQKDVFIDLVCFRRHGHNESDEPRVTQPAMYREVDAHPGTRALYAKQLLAEGVLAEGEEKKLQLDYRDALDRGESVVELVEGDEKALDLKRWEPFDGQRWTAPGETGIAFETLRNLGTRLTALPEGFKTHPRVAAILKSRTEMTAGTLPLDWGMAENLAYASLLTEGYNVRISGQDSGRGTFFHRHAAFHNQVEAGEPMRYIPLAHLQPEQGSFEVLDSPLSEEAVLGFEYGYASTDPNALVVWEAQFGDFANGAQAIIDQYIAAGEVKWHRYAGLVMLLPHGYEGQGPEHSSARLERYLQLCAEENIQVIVPSTPAQLFHALRRQMIRAYRKPLIVMMPKSLLRHKASVASLEDLAKGRFNNVIGDGGEAAGIDRVVIASGKVYFELLDARAKQALQNVALVRLEQLYPFPMADLRAELAKYPNAQVVWAQEEPQNQGAWLMIRDDLHASLASGQSLSFAARPRAASTAVGTHNRHVEQQQVLINQALGLHKVLEEKALTSDQFLG